tara:strand:+ start:1060 stop:2850 length:1791 start_codon:yes stop_codon:yes gene_type:complete
MAEYGVNIKITANTSKLDLINRKANELANAVEKVNAVNLNDITSFKGNAGRELKKTKDQLMGMVSQVNATNKAFGSTIEQQEGALQGFEALRKSMTVGTKDFNIVTEAINRQTKAMQEQNKQFGINQRKQINPRGNKAALQSGLISGAFPMLFGQGPLGGAAGFAGGFVGTKMGGKMGGFAGGLVATAVLQQIQTLVTNINTLANAFDILNPNIEQLTISLGIAGTVEAERLKILEQTEGTHVALAAATEKMNQVIGENGVKNLKEFAESSRLLGNSFKSTMTKIQAALAPFFKALTDMANTFTGATQLRDSELLALAESQGGTDVDKLNALRDKLEGIDGTKQNTAKINQLKGQISRLEKQLIEEGKLLEMAQLRNDQFNQATKSITDQNTELQNQISLGKLGAEIEAEKKRIADAMEIAVEDLTAEMLNQLEIDLKLQDSLERTLSLYEGIADTVQTGLVDAIDGAITGTMTLGEVASSVFGSIRRQLIDFGATSLLKAVPGIGGFFADGGVTKPNKSYIVGERGPELFTPGVTGRVTPNHELGGGSTSVVVNVDASGSSVEGDSERSRELGQMLSAAIQSELIKQKRPGGLLT